MEVENIIHSEDLWVLFRLKGNLYAVNSKCTSGIAREAGQVTLVPESKPYVRGITKAWGKVLALIDLRVVFGIQTMQEEFNEFSGVMDSAKEAHRKWVAELCHCAEKKSSFSLEKNPHHCAFGLWYDKYEAPVKSVKKCMDRIRDPHYALHHLSVDYDRELAKKEPSDEKLKNIADKAMEIQKQIFGNIDAAEEVFKENYRTMMIEIKTSDSQEVALIVDEIVGVEPIGDIYYDETVEKMAHSPLLSQTASTSDGKELLFLIDEKEVGKLLAESGIQPKDLNL